MAGCRSAYASSSAFRSGGISIVAKKPTFAPPVLPLGATPSADADRGRGHAHDLPDDLAQRRGAAMPIRSIARWVRTCGATYCWPEDVRALEVVERAVEVAGAPQRVGLVELGLECGAQLRVHRGSG